MMSEATRVLRLSTSKQGKKKGDATAVSIPWKCVLRAAKGSKKEIRASSGLVLHAYVLRKAISKRSERKGVLIPMRWFRDEDGKKLDEDGFVLWVAQSGSGKEG